MARPVRNPTLADDGLPREMYRDVLRACHRWLMTHDPGYKFEQIDKARRYKRSLEIPDEGPERPDAPKKRWISRGVRPL